MPRFAMLTFVGPGETEAVRLAELLESLNIFEPTVDSIVIIDDSSKQSFQTIIPKILWDRCVILHNPRDGQGDWWLAGLAVGLTHGLRWIAAERKVDFVIRLDTDAIVVRPFANALFSMFRAMPSAGILGTWDKYPVDGRARLPKVEVHAVLRQILLKATRHLTIWRHDKWPTRLQCTLCRQDRLVRRVIKQAVRNGYSPGNFVQGGGYAMSYEVIQRCSREGFLQAPRAFMGQFFSEDVLATLLCYAVKLAPFNFNATGEVFAVAHGGLPASPETLHDMGYAIAHPVKSAIATEEREIREAFKRLRKPNA